MHQRRQRPHVIRQLFSFIPLRLNLGPGWEIGSSVLLNGAVTGEIVTEPSPGAGIMVNSSDPEEPHERLFGW